MHGSKPINTDGNNMRVSVIIPTYNEAARIEHTITSLCHTPAEIIVVDGGSGDDTVSRCDTTQVTVMHSPAGRAQQMNMGARHATDDVLLFLHADTVLEDGWYDSLCAALRNPRIIGGAFHVQFDRQRFSYRLLNLYSNLRAQWTGMYHGDQAMFIRKQVFDKIGGFPAIPLMEDVVLSRRMRRAGKTTLLRARAITSARRIEKIGVTKSILRYMFFKTAFFFGASPYYLARIHRKSDK